MNTFRQIKIKSIIQDFVFRSLSPHLLNLIEGERLQLQMMGNNYIPLDELMKPTEMILKDQIFDIFSTKKIKTIYSDNIIKIE